jgi:hypothetical protein
MLNIFQNFFVHNYSWLIPFIIAGIFVPFIIHYLQKRNAGNISKNPEVYVTENRDRHFFNIEILNTGSEDITNLQGKIFWKQEGKEQRRELNSFIKEQEDQLFASPRGYKILRKDEKIIAVNIPHSSDDGLIKVFISGIGSASKKELKRESIIRNDVK